MLAIGGCEFSQWKPSFALQLASPRKQFIRFTQSADLGEAPAQRISYCLAKAAKIPPPDHGCPFSGVVWFTQYRQRLQHAGLARIIRPDQDVDPPEAVEVETTQTAKAVDLDAFE